MDLVHEFKTALKDLYKSKTPIPRSRIALVASVAIKANRMYKHVVMYLEKYAEKIPGKYKLTALCVIDSIIRQSRKEFGRHKDLYGPRFRKKLKLIFRFLKKCKQRDKAHMVRILTLWQKHMIYASEVVEPLLSIISPDLKSPKKPRGQLQQPAQYGVAHSVAANALAIIEQQQTQIQALQQLQALKNLNSLTPSFVQAIQSLHYHQQLIAEGKEHEIPKELLEQLRLLYSLVQQSADPQPLDYSGLLRSNRKFYQQQKTHESTVGYTVPMSSLELPGISGAYHPGSPRDRTLAPYRSIKSNQAPPARRNTSLLDDFDYGDDEDDAERIAAQKRRVELEKKRVEVAARARESARAREKNKRRKKREVKKKKTAPGNATPTQDEVDSPRRYKNQDIDNELERLLLTSSVGEVVRLHGTHPGSSPHDDSNGVMFSPISNINSPALEQDTRDGVSPISPDNNTESEHDEAIMEEYFARTPSNISEDFADENQPLVICTEEQKEGVQNGEQVENPVDPRTKPEDKQIENSINDISQDLPLEDTISLPDSTVNMDDLEVPDQVNSPLPSQASQEEMIETSAQPEPDNTPPDEEQPTPPDSEPQHTLLTDDEDTHIRIDDVTPSLDIFQSSPLQPELTRVTPETSGDEDHGFQIEPTAYDPLFPTQDLDEISHASPVREEHVHSPYASSLEEIFPDFASSNKSVSPSPSDISLSIKDAISPVTGSPNSSRSSSPPHIRNPSPPNSPKTYYYNSPNRNVNNGFLKSIFDVALPFDNITPPHESCSSSCISDVSPPPKENKIESVTPPPSGRYSPLRSLLESVRERVKDMEMIEDIEGYESGMERRIAVTFKKKNDTEKKILRSVIFVKNNKQSAPNFKSTVQKKKRYLTPSSPSSSSLSSCSESSDSAHKKRTKKPRTHKTKKETHRHVSTHSSKLKAKRPVKSSRSDNQNCRQVRRVRSASIDSLDETFPPINKKDFLIIYTNIIKVENGLRVIEKYHLRKYLSTCVGDIELFDIINDRTAALIQLSNRKSADRLKQRLEQAEFLCIWVPGFKVLPGFHWDRIDGVSYIPWNNITDDPPYNIFSLSKGGTIDFIEIKKELELIDKERALEREKAATAEMEARAAQDANKLGEQKTQHSQIRLCCQDSEHSDSPDD